MYICMCICMYVSMYICRYTCMYVYTNEWKFLAWYSIAQSVCQWAFSLLEIRFQRPSGFESCIQQRKTTCLLSIRKSLACARASKLTTNMPICMYISMYICRCTCMYAYTNEIHVLHIVPCGIYWLHKFINILSTVKLHVNERQLYWYIECTFFINPRLFMLNHLRYLRGSTKRSQPAI